MMIFIMIDKSMVLVWYGFASNDKLDENSPLAAQLKRMNAKSLIIIIVATTT